MIELINSDARRIPLKDKTVQLIITSPPYWGLRSYLDSGDELKQSEIGLEPTPAAYVASISAVMRECWRVLKDDGVLWLNLGDSYASAPAGNSDATFTKKQASNAGSEIRRSRSTITDGLKPKDLCGIPWRVAFALQDAGWYLRQDIIWSKPNPMPESVTDRCTKAHEYVFLLTKQARYYYDAEAVKENYRTADPSSASYRKNGKSDSRVKHAIYCAACDGSGDGHDGECGDDCEVCNGTGRADIGGAKTAVKNEGFWKPEGSGRNRRSVWTVATHPYSGAHYATFPYDLVSPMVLAGSKKGDIVLDPFCGSGTVGEVCRDTGRNFIGLDLSLKYLTRNAMPRAQRKNTESSIKELPLFAGY